MWLYSFETALTFYFAATIIGLIELAKTTKTVAKIMLTTAGIGLALHTVSIIYRYTESGHLPISSPHEAASFFAWCTVLLFFVLHYRYKLGLLGTFIMPVVFLLMLTSAFLSRELKPLSPVLQSNWLGIHTFFAFMGNAAFVLAFVTGIMYLIQEHYIKSKHLGDLFSRLPSIQTLDYVNYRLITLGFPMLTMAIITGALWANSAWGRYWNWDPREAWSMATWFIYAGILHARMIAGWRGRRASWLSIIGFATVIVSFFIIKFLMKGLHVFQ